MKKIISSFSLLLLLSACSSHNAEERKIEEIASNRVAILNSELPVENGPLSILKAFSNKNTIELVMIYNDSATGALPTKLFLHNSMVNFCKNKEVIRNLDSDVLYRIKIRNSRGQLMVDQPISPDVCSDLSN